MSDSHGRISYRGITLKAMLMKAYGLKPYQISGPAWIENEHYDVLAKAPEGASIEEVPEMLQALLLERFRIALHSEAKERSVYVLRVGKDGLKVKAASNDHPGSKGGYTIDDATGRAEMKLIGKTMNEFADFLTTQLDRPIIDGTGLHGKFDFTLPFDAQDMQPGADSLPSSLIAALHGLVLQLEPGKLPIPYLTIDKAQKIPLEIDGEIMRITSEDVAVEINLTRISASYK